MGLGGGAPGRAHAALGAPGFGSWLPTGPSEPRAHPCARVAACCAPSGSSRRPPCVLEGPSSGCPALTWTGVAQPVLRGSMSRSAGQHRRQLTAPAAASVLPCGRWLWLCSPGETPGPAGEARTPLPRSVSPRAAPGAASWALSQWPHTEAVHGHSTCVCRPCCPGGPVARTPACGNR